MENTKILKGLFVFRGLNQIELAQFNKVLGHMRVAADERVVNEGDSAERMYIITKGTFRVVKGEPGEDKTVAVLSAGEHFGEVALIDNGPRSASVEALDDGELVFLERDDFERILNAYPDARRRVYENFLESLCERLRFANEHLLIAARPTSA